MKTKFFFEIAKTKKGAEQNMDLSTVFAYTAVNVLVIGMLYL